MTDAARQPKDENYNLIAALYQSPDNVGSLKTYIQNAQHEGNQELVEFFGGILENNLRVAQRAKEMLVSPLSGQARVAKRSLLPHAGAAHAGLRVRVPSVLTPTQKLPARSHFIREGPGHNAPALC